MALNSPACNSISFPTMKLVNGASSRVCNSLAFLDPSAGNGVIVDSISQPLMQSRELRPKHLGIVGDHQDGHKRLP